MSDTPTAFLLTPEGMFMALVGTQFAIPFSRWAASQLWSRLNQKEEEQDRDKRSLKQSLREVAAEMRAGFASTQNLISQQHVSIAEMRVQLAQHAKEIDALRAASDELRSGVAALEARAGFQTQD